MFSMMPRRGMFIFWQNLISRLTTPARNSEITHSFSSSSLLFFFLLLPLILHVQYLHSLHITFASFHFIHSSDIHSFTLIPIIIFTLPTHWPVYQRPTTTWQPPQTHNQTTAPKDPQPKDSPQKSHQTHLPRAAVGTSLPLHRWAGPLTAA